MEPSSNFQQGSHSTVEFGTTGCGFSDARQDLEKRRLARPVWADNAHDRTARYVERHVPKGPEVVGRLFAAFPPERVRERCPERLTQTSMRRAKEADLVLLGNALNDNGVVGHQITSANVCSVRLK